MVDLVIVNPNNHTPGPFAACEPPLWASLIAGHNLAQGKEVAIVDAEAEGLNLNQTAERVKAYDPKEIVISVMGNNPSVSSTPKMPVASELMELLPGAKLAGLHPNAMNYPNTIRNPFNGCPVVPWSLLPMDKYRAHNWHCLDDVDKRSPYGVLYTSLNCPYNCSYCNVHALYGDRKMRYREMQEIYSDLKYFALTGIRHIKIWDELFTLDEERVNKVCDYIIAQGFQFNIWAYARVDTVNYPLLQKMKAAGINWLAYGFESASNEVRYRSNKKFEGTQAYKAIAITKDAGINIMGNYVFGLPGETLDSMKANLDMAIRENFEFVNFYVALPYPGSQWYNSLKVKPTDWTRFNQYAPKIYADSNIVRFRDYAFDAYFSRPEYLGMIRTKFGKKAETHIVSMLQWRFR